jgi:hypothetical protein
LEIWRSWKIDIASTPFARGRGRQSGRDRGFRAVFLDLFDETRKSGQWVIKEVMNWYSHAADEVNYFIARGDEHMVRDYQEFLRLFREDFGVAFFAMSGALRKVIDRVLKTRKVQSDAEYEALVEATVNLDTLLLSEIERENLERLLSEYSSAQ